MGGTSVVVIGPGAIITAGGVAILEIITYKPGHPTGPFTGAGEGLGNILFPPTLDMPPATCPQMSKGGKQRGGGDDPRYDKTCDQLEKDYEDAKSRRDSKAAREIQRIMKENHCHGSGNYRGTGGGGNKKRG